MQTGQYTAKSFGLRSPKMGGVNVYVANSLFVVCDIKCAAVAF